ncbi:FtsQ-type POTRA domain-containing protein, partial [bacterium]|nr:FtsQ-type POTRA domain-containing protein [bacterium]
ANKKKLYSNTNIKVIAVHIVSGLFFLGILGFLVLNINKYLKNDPGFTIKKVVVENNVNVSADQIIRVLGISKNQNIFKLKVNECAEKLLKLPSIKNIRIFKKLPDKIVVRIYERTPIFQFYNGCYFYVDDEGIVLDKMTRRPDPSLPIVEGVNIPVVNFGTKLEKPQLFMAMKAVKAYNQSTVKKSITITNIDVGKSDNIVILTSSGGTIYFGKDDFLYRMQKLNEISRDLTKKQLVFNVIDLRFENVPVTLRN